MPASKSNKCQRCGNPRHTRPKCNEEKPFDNLWHGVDAKDKERTEREWRQKCLSETDYRPATLPLPSHPRWKKDGGLPIRSAPDTKAGPSTASSKPAAGAAGIYRKSIIAHEDIHHTGTQTSPLLPINPPPYAMSSATKAPALASTPISKQGVPSKDDRDAIGPPKPPSYPKPNAKDILSNYFPVIIDKSVELYQYTITYKSAIFDTKRGKAPAREVNGTILNRVQKKSLIKALFALEELQRLDLHMATDFIDTIVSWKSLACVLSPDRATEEVEDEVLFQHAIEHRAGSSDNNQILIGLNFSKKHSLDNFKSHCQGVKSVDIIKHNVGETTRLLNILLTRHIKEHPLAVQVTANKIFFNCNHMSYASPLRQANTNQMPVFSAITGIFTNFTAGMSQPLLNVNTSTSAFLRHECSNLPSNKMTVAAFMSGLFALIPLDRQYEEAAHMLSNVRVWVKSSRTTKSSAQLDEEGARVKRIAGLGKVPAMQQTFIKDKKQIKVLDHLHKEYGWAKTVPSAHQNYPCVNVGGTAPGKEVWFPPTELEILPFQVYNRQVPSALMDEMLKVACRSPAANKQFINGIVNEVLTPDASGFKTICPGVKVQLHLLKVPSHCLKTPAISLSKAKPEISHRGSWPLREGEKFASCPDKSLRIQFVWLQDGSHGHEATPQRQNSRQGIKAFFLDTLSQRGFKVNAGAVSEQKITQIGQLDYSFKGTKADLVVLYMRRPDVDAYARFKKTADLIIGIQSICITGKADTLRPAYMTNVALKVNTKFPGSVNQVVEISNKRNLSLMILGADVTHSGQSAIQGMPSIAALIGSIDKTLCRYLGSLSLQKVKNDRQSKEIIEKDSMITMFTQRLKQFFLANNRKLPDHIVYYRDGVGAGQYKDFKATEVAAILEVLAERTSSLKISKKPTLTAIVAEKRHHSRFYPILDVTGDHAIQNCHFGTIVDDTVTSPYHHDFYLQSHHALQGTVRPTHYFVVHDDINMSREELQNLTHQLCFSYQRSTSAVSYVPATYYADHLAERGRRYLADFLHSNNFFERVIWDIPPPPASRDATRVYARTIHAEFVNQQVLMNHLKDSRSDLHTEARELIHAAVVMEMNSYAGANKSENGPWHKNLDNTMFWL